MAWTPPQDELVAATKPTVSDSKPWSPPVEEAIGGATSDDSDPGTLKSAAAGLMSGIPLAETATAGIKSALGDKSYEEEHKALEDLKDKAWEKHPVAYGAGKGTGIVGSTLLAPESAAGRIALAAGMGAGAGIDAADKTSDIPMDALKGAGEGAALGTVGEGVGALVSKVLPKAAKGTVASLAGGKENMEGYLADRAGVNASLDPVPAAEKLADRANDINTASGHLSEDAVSKLNPDKSPISIPTRPEPSSAPTMVHGQVENELGEMVPQKTVITHGSHNIMGGSAGSIGEDTLTPLFGPIEQKLTVNGTAVGQAQRNALNSLQGYKQSLSEIAAKNGGQIPETALGKIVRDMQHDVNWNVDDKVVNSAKAQFEGTLNDLLKKANPEYGTAMEPVSELKTMGSDVGNKFKLDTDNDGNIINSDTTNSKMANINEEKNSNLRNTLDKFGDLTGFDFIKNAKLNDIKRALSAGGNSNQLLNVIGHTGGYIGGKLTGIPGGGLVGSLIGGTAAHAADGGAIAKGLMDRYLNGMETMSRHPEAMAALKKYGPMLVAAAKQGGNQLAATHFVLATSHPEYQDLIDQTQEQQ